VQLHKITVNEECTKPCFNEKRFKNKTLKGGLKFSSKKPQKTPFAPVFTAFSKPISAQFRPDLQYIK